MSDTPRTDGNLVRVERNGHWYYDHVHADLARTLERELAVVTAERDQARRHIVALHHAANSAECKDT